MSGFFFCNMHDLGTSVMQCLFCEVLMGLSDIMVVQIQERVALGADPGNTLIHFYKDSLSIMHLSCDGSAQSK